MPSNTPAWLLLTVKMGLPAIKGKEDMRSLVMPGPMHGDGGIDPKLDATKLGASLSSRQCCNAYRSDAHHRFRASQLVSPMFIW